MAENDDIRPSIARIQNDIVAVLEDLEKNGTDIETLGFQEALEEFELRGVNHLAPFAPWLTVKKQKYE